MTPLVTAFEPAWPDPENSCVPLDWWVHVGGFLRERLDAHLRTQADFGISLLLQMRPDPVLKFEIEAWLRDYPSALTGLVLTPNARAWSLENQIFQMLPLKPTPEIENAEKWFSRLQLPAAFQVYVSNFLGEMEISGVDRGEPPWVFWSRFPGWLKRRSIKGPDFAIMDLQLAFLRVALSPQDEVGESESLTPRQLMVNPTFEYSESQTAPLVALARSWDFVSHRPMTSLEAQVLDHVREAFRADRDAVLKVVSGETGVRKEFVNSAIESLVADSFLLANSGGSAGLSQ